MEENIKTFFYKPGDILYAINHNVGVLSLCIDHIDLLYNYSSTNIFRIYFKFVNSHELLYFEIDARYIEQNNITLRHVFSKTHNIYNKDYPQYLIGTDKGKLINYYIKKLQKSIDYQQDVVNRGLSQIKELQNKIESFKNLI